MWLTLGNGISFVWPRLPRAENQSHGLGGSGSLSSKLARVATASVADCLVSLGTRRVLSTRGMGAPMGHCLPSHLPSSPSVPKAVRPTLSPSPTSLCWEVSHNGSLHPAVSRSGSLQHCGLRGCTLDLGCNGGGRHNGSSCGGGKHTSGIGVPHVRQATLRANWESLHSGQYQSPGRSAACRLAESQLSADCSALPSGVADCPPLLPPGVGSAASGLIRAVNETNL